ncbi:hypothetical protein RSC2_04305 [Bacillus paralicheniformis]|nr:hypothetical protein RSC1_02437 [Bacillus paralicheniformis]BCE12509.1 hypothetical protein RSC2_04305 [Bacillus paralicheniformis]BCE14143.1 hypothetical protein RSC3_01499 [Bacillus paralicheniformis]
MTRTAPNQNERVDLVLSSCVPPKFFSEYMRGQLSIAAKQIYGYAHKITAE